MAKDGALRISMVVLACLLLCAPAAEAAKKKKAPRKPGAVVTRSAQASVVPHKVGIATATCPGKTRAVGGGFEAAPGGIEPTLVTSSRMVSAKSWSASAIRNAPLTTADGVVTAFVRCRLAAPKLTAISATAVLPAATTPGSVGAATATASCPPKLKVVAGGFETSVDPVTTLGAIPQESRRLGKRAWQASAVHSNTTAKTVAAYAYCARSGVSQKTAQASMKGDLGTKSADAAGCPSGRPVSGGFLTSGGSLLGGGNIVYVMASRPQGKAWRSTGLHSGPLSTGVLRSYLYCG